MTSSCRLNLNMDSFDLSVPHKPIYTTGLKRLQEASLEEITKLIPVSSSKTCVSDPLPTWLIKKCCDEVAPVITPFVNKSFHNACVPPSSKHAIIEPEESNFAVASQELQEQRQP